MYSEASTTDESLLSPFDRLRLVVSMAHHVPGATLTIERTDGDPRSVGRTADADIDLCNLRRMLMTAPTPARVAVAARISDIGCEGSLRPIRGDLFGFDLDGCTRRVFATVLDPGTAFDTLEGLDCDPATAGDVTANLRPDRGLGVTTVVMGTRSPALESRLDEVARLAHEACLVEELLVSARSPSARRPRQTTKET